MDCITTISTPHTLSDGTRTKACPSQAGSGSDSLAAVYSVTSAAPLRVFAPIVVSAAGASALAAPSSYQPSLAPAAGAPAPASAGASVDPVLAAPGAFPALADISCRAAASLCLDYRGVKWTEGR